MKALLLQEYRELSLADLPTPETGPDDVLIRVRACGICGSDIHGYDGSTGRRIPPLVMGHEAAGIIEKVGDNVTQFAAGERVTFDSTIYCGDCAFCKSGRINLCDSRRVLGVSCGDYRQNGAFAEFVAVPARVVYRLPDELPFEHAALAEAASVALHAVLRTPLEPGATVVVIGAGMIGLLLIQALREAAPAKIIAVDLDAGRLELAKRLGAHQTLNAADGDPAIAITERLAPGGADAAFEVVGAQTTVEAAIGSVRKGGAVTLVGNLSPRVEIPLQAVVTRELSLYGSCSSAGEYGRVLELMASGGIDVAPIISAIASLDDGPAWFDRLYTGEPGLMKVILQP